MGPRKDAEGSDQVKDGTSVLAGVEDLDAAIEDAKRASADVTEAEAISKAAKASLCLDREVEATMQVQQGLIITEKAHNRRVEQLLREARTVLEQEESKGVDTVGSWKQLAKAEDAFGASDYEATIWFLNMAIQSMGAAERLRNEALGSLAQNRWSLDKLSRLEPVSSPEVDLIQLQENLVAQGDYRGSLDMTEELEGRLAARLANHTGVLLGETRAHIDDLKHEDLMDEAKHARDAYKLAQRYVRERDTRSAICIIMRIEMDHDEALRRRREIPVVG